MTYYVSFACTDRRGKIELKGAIIKTTKPIATAHDAEMLAQTVAKLANGKNMTVTLLWWTEMKGETDDKV